MENWQNQAKCKDIPPSIFYQFTKEKDRIAKRVCIGCPVIDECFLAATSNNEKGIWGGTDENERNRLVTTSLLQGLPLISLLHKTLRERERPASVSPSYRVHTSYSRSHNQLVFGRALAASQSSFHVEQLRFSTSQ